MRTRRTSTLIALLILLIGPLILGATAQGTPEGEMVMAWHVTIAPAWFDPIDTPSQITPFGRPARAARCPGAPTAGGADGQQPGRVLDGEPRRASLRVQAARGLKFQTATPSRRKT